MSTISRNRIESGRKKILIYMYVGTYKYNYTYTNTDEDENSTTVNTRRYCMREAKNIFGLYS